METTGSLALLYELRGKDFGSPITTQNLRKSVVFLCLMMWNIPGLQIGGLTSVQVPLRHVEDTLLPTVPEGQASVHTVPSFSLPASAALEHCHPEAAGRRLAAHLGSVLSSNHVY